MPVLHLGVIDVPYASRDGKSTGDVAEILESKYHVMEVFYEQNKERVARDLERSLSGALENLLMGAPPSMDAFGAGTSKIEDKFKSFLSRRKMDRLGYPGVPTQAALSGVSHRFKRPRAGRKPRPSFIDTGLYQSSFKAWVD